MRIFFTTYKYSVWATIVDVIGSVCVATGIYGLFYAISGSQYMDILPSVITGGIGIGAKMLGSLINERVVYKKIKKSLGDPVLISKVRSSAVAAYSLYKGNPVDDIYEFVKIYNPFAAMRIAEISGGKISEENAIIMMREYDGMVIDESVNSSQSSIEYSNDIFKVTNVLTQKEQLESDYKKNSEFIKKCKKFTVTSLILSVLCFCGFFVNEEVFFIVFGSMSGYAFFISVIVLLSKLKNFKKIKEQLGCDIDFDS